LGFYTRNSQPRCEREDSTTYDIVDGKHMNQLMFLQRPYLEGYMKKERAIQLFKIVNSNPLFAKHHTIVSLYCDQTDIDFIHSIDNDQDTHKTIREYMDNKYKEGLNIDPNVSGYTYTNTKFDDYQNDDYDGASLGNINCKEEYAYVQITCRRFDDYDDLFWKTILEFLRKTY
jgi:hypothetical protein